MIRALCWSLWSGWMARRSGLYILHRAARQEGQAPLNRTRYTAAFYMPSKCIRYPTLLLAPLLGSSLLLLDLLCSPLGELRERDRATRAGIEINRGIFVLLLSRRAHFAVSRHKPRGRCVADLGPVARGVRDT